MTIDVERVARAIFAADNTVAVTWGDDAKDWEKEQYRGLALAAIEAIRESTEQRGPIMTMLEVGDRVEKHNGYKWPGIVIMRGYTEAGQLRYVVECTVPEVKGALHIYAPEQIRKVEL